MALVSRGSKRFNFLLMEDLANDETILAVRLKFARDISQLGSCFGDRKSITPELTLSSPTALVCQNSR